MRRSPASGEGFQKDGREVCGVRLLDQTTLTAIQNAQPSERSRLLDHLMNEPE